MLSPNLNQPSVEAPSAAVTDSERALWIVDVERAFRERHPSLFFVMPRVLRRVLRHELEISSPWMRIPHRKSYVIPRERLLWLVATDELGIESAALVPDRAILLARPEEDRLHRFDREGLLRYYWRLAYHAKIDAAMSEHTSNRRMSPAQLRYRIDRLGQERFDEVRAVLRQEGFLTHPDDPRNVYAEFVAVYAELSAFAPELVALYFPSIVDSESVKRLIQEDCNTTQLLEATRPPQLTSPLRSLATEDAADAIANDAPTARVTPSKWRYRWFNRSADRSSARGNRMRAAVLRRQAQQFAPPVSSSESEQQIEADLAEFAHRLQTALELEDAEARRWQQMCRQLLLHAAEGFWNANARLLYDLQKVCVDHEREIYRVDLARWLWTLGRSSLRRPLPDLKLVLIAKHLRTATRRISAVRISREHRRELEELLHRAAQRAEELLRRLLDPQIAATLHDVGMVPGNVVERAAFHKLVAELVDGVVERGFVSLGHLRDAIARSQLKLPDLSGVREFFTGDVLLRADRRLAVSLDGVYQRGPFYLRWLQRMSSLFFGTAPGRFITQYLALPFGGAFLVLKGTEFLSEEVHHFIDTPKLHVYSHVRLLTLGVLLLGLIHWPAFRQGAWLLIRSSWLLLRGLLIDVPRFLYHLPGIPQLLKSLPALLFRRYLLTPLLLTLVFWKGLPAAGVYDEPNSWIAIGLLVICFTALNSRLGRDSEELFWEFLGRMWHRFRVTVVIGLFNLIVDLFRQIMDAVERVLYSVDEWLRFRAGESSLSLGVKAVLGLVWGLVQGVIRFCVTLLIEPQINPIKHFPVVTVSHKLILPLVIPLSQQLTALTDPITAKAVATTIVTAIPGVFGFLAWELKENWRAYAANRSRTLRPVLVGHHGETLLRLLKPGFHSGTVPKLFARRRRVARKSQPHRNLSKHTKFDEKLHHEADAVRHFIERELLQLLRQSRRLGALPLSVTALELSTNRLSVLIGCAGSDVPLRISFAEQSGWLVVGMLESGWARHLDPDQQQILSTALAGLYHMSAVDLVREQLERQLGSPPHPYDINEGGLVVWPTRSYDTEVSYDLSDAPMITPRPRSVARLARLDPLPAAALIFRQHPIAWVHWRDFWEAEQTAADCPSALLSSVPVLRQ